MRPKNVLLTGSDGRIGSAIMQDLLAHGYQVTPVDKFPMHKWSAKIVDCEDLGQVVSMMKGHDAVIHMAAIPHPLSHPAEVVFRNNAISTFNILQAAAILEVKNVVLASSISALGTVNMVQHFNPLRVPVDEDHPLLSQDAYGLSKMVGEILADGFSRRIPDLSLASMRFSFVIDEDARESYMRNPKNQPHLDDLLAGVFWTYIDARDAAASCRLAMEADFVGHEAFYINAPKISSVRPVEELLEKYYPGNYPVAEHIRGSASPFDCGKAERLLGWKAAYDWEGNSFEAG
jgi:nucleoside-diphosphate-sugar epimerase